MGFLNYQKELYNRLNISSFEKFKVQHTGHENQNMYKDKVFYFSDDGLIGDFTNSIQQEKLMYLLVSGTYKIVKQER